MIKVKNDKFKKIKTTAQSEHEESLDKKGNSQSFQEMSSPHNFRVRSQRAFDVFDQARPEEARQKGVSQARRDEPNCQPLQQALWDIR